MYFSARAEGRISYGHLGRTNSCCYHFIIAPQHASACRVQLFSYQFYLSVRPSDPPVPVMYLNECIKSLHFLTDLIGSIPLPYFLESHRHYTFPRRTPLAWALNALGVEKYWKFLRTHRSYRKQYEKGPQLLC